LRREELLHQAQRTSESEQDEARRRAGHALGEITRLLHKQEALSEKEELMIKAQLCSSKSGHHPDE